MACLDEMAGRSIVVLAVFVACAGSGCGSSRGAKADGGTHTDATADTLRPLDGGIDATSMDAAADTLNLPPTAALRLVAPLSTSTVTSQRPTLRWSLDPSCDGAHVQICRDRACRREVTGFDVSGGSGAPAGNLPKGVLFWHAYGLNHGAIVQGWTPTWQFTVGARSAPVDTSWGTTLDVNGDGYADVAVGEPGTGQVNVYLGGPSGPPTSPSLVLSQASGVQALGVFLSSAGDVNGDGYADLLVGGIAAAYLYLGGPAGLATSPTTVRLPQPAQSGVRVTGAGDVNGDGYADVAVANYDWSIAYVYLGGADGLAPTPTVTLDAPPAATPFPGPIFVDGFGHSLAGAGDVNGDGYADLVVAAPDANTNGQAYVYLGSPSGISATPSFTLSESDGPGADSVSSADDVNGDGYADLVVGGYDLSGQTAGDSAGRAYLYLGGASGPSTSPALTLVGPQAGGTFGRWVSRAGDVNGDGYADVLIGADAEYGSPATAPGSAYVYLGGASGLSATPTVTLTGPDGLGSWFGRCVAGAGDVNGDGYADVVIGADAGSIVLPADAGALSAAGWAYVYLGNSSGVASAPAVRWVGASNSSVFGRAVASALRSSSLDRPS